MPVRWKEMSVTRRKSSPRYLRRVLKWLLRKKTDKERSLSRWRSWLRPVGVSWEEYFVCQSWRRLASWRSFTFATEEVIGPGVSESVERTVSLSWSSLKDMSDNKGNTLSLGSTTQPCTKLMLRVSNIIQPVVYSKESDREKRKLTFKPCSRVGSRSIVSAMLCWNESFWSSVTAPEGTFVRTTWAIFSQSCAALTNAGGFFPKDILPLNSSMFAIANNGQAPFSFCNIITCFEPQNVISWTW